MTEPRSGEREVLQVRINACPELAEAPLFEPGPEAVPRCE